MHVILPLGIDKGIVVREIDALGERWVKILIKLIFDEMLNTGKDLLSELYVQ